jgi:hypothetical protein
VLLWLALSGGAILLERATEKRASTFLKTRKESEVIRRQVGIRAEAGFTTSDPRTVVFEYIGRTALTAIGGVTGQRYRFEEPGARLAVDQRDRASLNASPVLKQVG